jgi:TolA-binding protein
MNKNSRIVLLLAVFCLGGLASVISPAGSSQDLTFRVTTLERRVDQMQTRVDFIERAQQNQAMQANAAISNLTTQTVLELQRQHLSLAEQVVQMQKRMLDLQKAIDRLVERDGQSEKPEKRDPAEAKPKPRAGKP